MWTLLDFHMRVAPISIFDNVRLSINFIIFLYRCNGGQYGNQGFYIQFTPPIYNSDCLYSAVVSRLWTMLVCSALVDFTRSAHTKGQFISKANCQTVNFFKQRTNKFVFTSMRRVFVCFLWESSDRKKNVSRLSDL